MKEHLKPLLLIAQLLISIAVSACNPGNPTIPVSRARGKPVRHTAPRFRRTRTCLAAAVDGSHCEFGDVHAHECLMEGWSRPENIPGAALSFAWAVDLLRASVSGSST